MKLTKEEIQKVALGAMISVAVIYAYFSLLLWPLMARQKAVHGNITALEPQIVEAKAALKKTELAEKDGPKAVAILTQVGSLIPEGAPVAWFPPRVADFFKNRGVDKAVTRSIGDTTDKDLPGFRRIAWSVDVPKAEFTPFAAALAQFENEEPLVQVTSLIIEPNREDLQSEHAVLNFSHIVKQ